MTALFIRPMRLSTRYRAAGVVVVGCALAQAVAFGGARQAAADPLADAKQQAASLQAQVSALQTQAEQASEKYDTAEAALGTLVGEQRLAQQRVAAAQAVVDSDRATVNERARALYISGGTFVLYATLLQGINPDQVATGLHDVAAMTNADHRMLAHIDAATTAAKQAQASVDALLQTQNDLTAQADAAANQVQNLLTRQRQALQDANAQVRTIEAQIQAQIDADNAARAAQMLAAARQAALQSGVVITTGSQVAQAAIEAAATQLGKAYVYGGSGPDVWDCSGLTQWAFDQVGVALPRTAAEQYAAVATKVPLGELQAGDLLFWATDLSNPTTIHHVAIYLGNGQMLAAPHTGTVVQIQPVYLDGYFGAVRPA
ncbi:MAG: NlpC/P60 family protein [Acidothermaceae bacterium]